MSFYDRGHNKKITRVIALRYPRHYKTVCISLILRSVPASFRMKEGKHMSTLKVPGAQLYYEVSGDGPLLILIPGAAGTGEVFRPLTGPLAERYQVVTYDRRGFSRSELDGHLGFIASPAEFAKELMDALSR
jgi:hypothetical protein